MTTAAHRRARPQNAPGPLPRPASLHNADVAAAFERIADLLELEDANPFRVRAYRNGARVVRDLGVEVGGMVQRGDNLTELPGIGTDLARQIRELASTGTSTVLASLEARTPPALAELLRIPGLGPKRIRALYLELGIETLADLERAAAAGRIHDLYGFGEKTEERILRAIEAREPEAGRFLLSAAQAHAEALVAWLRAHPVAREVIVAGSFRRARETVGDLDILATAADAVALMDRFVAYDEVTEVTEKGPTRATVVLRSGLQVDLRVVPGESYGAALHYFTGSKAHSIAVRRLGVARGLKINEYGVFRGDRRVAGETEASVLASVGLPFIPPELREDRGEIEAAQAGRLPTLVKLGDLRGDLHAHTRATDGRGSLREMAEAARALGREYLAITDHSRRLAMAHGLDARRLEEQIEAIDRLNEEGPGVAILKGIEVDILHDGTLDLPDEVLGRLDVVVGAVHGRFGLDREAQTTRLLKAMDRPFFSILAHPTGRLLGRREPYEVDLVRVLRHAKERGCFVELDSQPERLDLPDVYARVAKDEGVLVSLSSDAHAPAELGLVRFGVGQARRGWLEKKDVLNTRPLAELRALLHRGRGRGA